MIKNPQGSPIYTVDRHITMWTIHNIIDMTTISVTDDVRDKLFKIASELQIRLHRRVDLNEAIRFLIDEKEKKPDLLDQACRTAPGADEALRELYRERQLDEERLERKTSIRR